MKVGNGRGQSVNSPFASHEEACDAFLARCGEDSWVHYWIHKYAMDAAPKVTNGVATPSNRAIAFLGDMFLLAQGMQHLIKSKAKTHKLPMIRLHFWGQRFKFYLSDFGTICLKSGQLEVEEYESVEVPGEAPKQVPCKWTRDAKGDEFYIGRFTHGQYDPCRVNQQKDRDGRFIPNTGTVRPPNATEAEMLKRLQANPVVFFTQCSKDMGRCVFCNAPLEDQRSKDAGCGETCSKRYGIPWGGAKWGEKVPSFAEQHDEDAMRLCDAIRANPKDEKTWGVFADWLEEHGLMRCQMPKGVVRVPQK